jgi:hypothetical protein
LEGDELDEFSALLEGDELDELPVGSVLLEGELNEPPLDSARSEVTVWRPTTLFRDFSVLLRLFTDSLF